MWVHPSTGKMLLIGFRGFRVKMYRSYSIMVAWTFFEVDGYAH